MISQRSGSTVRNHTGEAELFACAYRKGESVGTIDVFLVKKDDEQRLASLIITMHEERGGYGAATIGLQGIVGD